MPFFIDDIIQFDTNQEIEITENILLRLATKEEKIIIRDTLKRFGRFADIFSFDYHEYESSNSPRFGGKLKKREEIDHRFCVVEEKNSTKYNLTIPKAFLLTEKDYFSPFGFSILKTGGVSYKYSFDELCTFSYYNDINMVFNGNKGFLMKSFEEEDRLQVANNLKLLNEWSTREDNFPIITKALNDFFNLNEISNNSVFKFISYFACLEMLVVNGGIENLKPIKIQLENKFNLLNNRFKNPIQIEKYIKGPDTLTLGNVIKIMYNYRSSIAHGDFIDFQKKLKIIEKTSTEDLLNLLRITLKKTILFSLQEPELIRDLKKC